jgi:signal transduction histidine kinase/DNA-binding response OmpR family regulator
VIIESITAGQSTYDAADIPTQLGVNQRSLSIDYTAPAFLTPQNIRFRYRLDPYDADWIEAGSRRTAFYTGLPPGRYTFRVIASNLGDVWNEVGNPLRLDLGPRFHETGTARLLLGLALLGLTVGIFRWRMSDLRRRERELTRIVDERTAALRHNELALAAQNTRLAEMDQAKSRLFSNLSHEFRTPLTLILGPVRSILDGRHGPVSGAVREQADLMLRNGQRLLRLINQVLDLTKLQAGQMKLELQADDLAAFARRVTQAFVPLAERRQIALRFHSDQQLVPVRFDAEQLEKVLLNLLSNAVKFTEAGGTVDVMLSVEGRKVQLAVQDSGVGIRSEELTRIFERFYQADASATRRYEGTGIGLALARELVELHGGEIKAESTPGAGSTFTVALPLDTSNPLSTIALRDGGSGDHAEVDSLVLVSAEHPTTNGAETTHTDRTTILIVDDNADVRAYVRSVLSASYEIIEAADGAAGLERARADLPDLIVADVMMPTLDGLAMGRALKDDPMTDAIPLVLLTARAASEDQIAGLETGADAYVIKPFDPEVLEAQVANLLVQRRRLRERFRSGQEALPAPEPAAISGLEQRLRPVVEAHLTDPEFGPNEFAAAASLTYNQLYYALHEQLQTTPSRFVRSVRVECAAVLLKQGAGSVTEVAYSVGFESLSYFNRAFRERFGTSPTGYIARPKGR